MSTSPARKHLIATGPWLLAATTLVACAMLYRHAHALAQRAKAAEVFPMSTRYRDDNAALPPPSQGRRRIVMFGDSRIEQWHPAPDAGIEWVNRGISGETSAQMRLRIDDDVIALRPDVVVLQLGVNDLAAIAWLPERRDEIVAQCEANLRFIVDRVLQSGAEVILFTIIPRAEPGLLRAATDDDAIDEAIERINGAWVASVQRQGLTIVDARQVLQDRAGRWFDDVNADRLHLTPRGYARMDAALRPLLAR